MKKGLIVLFVICFMCGLGYAADQDLTDQTEDETPTADDIIYVVDDPGGTPADKKVTLANVKTVVSDWLSDETTVYLNEENKDKTLIVGSLSSSTGNVVINDNVEVTGSLIFTDSDGMTIDGDLTTTSDIIVNSARLVDGKDALVFFAKGTTAEVVADYIYLDDNYFTNGFTATDIMISRDATADGAMSISTVIGTWGATGFTADSVVETITFGANDFTAEDDGTLTTSALTANKFLGIYTGTDASERYNVMVTGYRE